jgi:hypothetical protein
MTLSSVVLLSICLNSGIALSREIFDFLVTRDSISRPERGTAVSLPLLPLTLGGTYMNVSHEILGEVLEHS